MKVENLSKFSTLSSNSQASFRSRSPMWGETITIQSNRSF